MIFEPAPPNDFLEFMRAYHRRCQAVMPMIRVVAAKWTFEDLIPGLSDFDTRFITEDGMTTADWARMSLAVGTVHTDLAREQPRWARNLEHLPGLNITLSEMTNPLFYYPEFQQWTLYDGDPDYIKNIGRYLAGQSWSARDELFHLKKIATYFGPYQRGIDPAINIGKWENKYPLHSRYMHYFTPPVQAAVSLVVKRGVRGKLEALRLARNIFPNHHVIDLLLNAIDRHYEIPEDYREPRLTWIERSLEAYLADMWQTVSAHVTLLRVEPDDDREAIRRKVAAIPVDPAEAFYEGVKFARLMKGRLLFYSQRIDWFDSIWLIQNELGRIVANFHDKPLVTYGKLRFGQTLSPAQVLERLRGELLTAEECDGMATFAKVAAGPLAPGREKWQAAEVAAHYDAALITLEKLSHDLLRLVTQRGGAPAYG